MEADVRPPAIGRKIRDLRKEQGLTQDELALRSGVSKSMLSQIESDSVNPTIATVWKIANGLGITFQALLEGKDEEIGRFEIARAEEATILDSRDGQTHFQVLSPLSMVDDLEFYILNMAPGGTLDSDPHFKGSEEYLTVLEGHIRVTSGDRSADLGPGDFVIYNADVHHSIQNLGDKMARVHLVDRFVRE
jgi:transcriptional regulator with XRE-family HTH domain